MSPERVSVGEEGEGHSMSMDQRQKRRGNQHCLVRGIWKLRSRAHSTGGNVKLKTVTEVRHSVNLQSKIPRSCGAEKAKGSSTRRTTASFMVTWTTVNASGRR